MWPVKRTSSFALMSPAAGVTMKSTLGLKYQLLFISSSLTGDTNREGPDVLLEAVTPEDRTPWRNPHHSSGAAAYEAFHNSRLHEYASWRWHIDDRKAPGNFFSPRASLEPSKDGARGRLWFCSPLKCHISVTHKAHATNYEVDEGSQDGWQDKADKEKSCPVEGRDGSPCPFADFLHPACVDTNLPYKPASV